MLHPARTIPFDALIDGLEKAREQGNIYRRDDTVTGRSLYCYTKQCVYGKVWDEFSMIARGLIVNLEQRKILATPFVKFYNYGEGRVEMPDVAFEAFEKMDGSLIIIYHDDGKWCTSTKGSMESSQALWAEQRLVNQNTDILVPGTTYLAEAIYSENRIVISYPDEGLVLLGAYREDGSEIEHDELLNIAGHLGWRNAERYSFDSFDALVRHAETLSVNEEGFVIRFFDGQQIMRLKVKGAEYCRVHAMISRCTPLALWESLVACDDTEIMRKMLPEEFWADFDNILSILTQKVDDIYEKIAVAAKSVSHLSDKELGLSNILSREIRGLVFSYRKGNTNHNEKMHHTILQMVRPTGNFLEGYKPSYTIERVETEMSM